MRLRPLRDETIDPYLSTSDRAGALAGGSRGAHMTDTYPRDPERVSTSDYIDRLRVPGGWLVWRLLEYGCAGAFLPDHDGAWVLEDAPAPPTRAAEDPTPQADPDPEPDDGWAERCRAIARIPCISTPRDGWRWWGGHVVTSTRADLRICADGDVMVDGDDRTTHYLRRGGDRRWASDGPLVAEAERILAYVEAYVADLAAARTAAEEERKRATAASRRAAIQGAIARLAADGGAHD